MNNPQKTSTRLRWIASDLYEAIPGEGLTPDWDLIEPLLDGLFALADEIGKEEGR